MPITQNLYDAPRYLRQHGRERIMWIDAICINQKNDFERTQQVGIIKHIYKNAIHVLIWLGKETAEDADAFNLLSSFEKSFKEQGLVDVGNVEDYLYGLELPVKESKEWAALGGYFSDRGSTNLGASRGSHGKRDNGLALSVQSSGLLGTYQVHPHAPGISCAVVIGKLKIAHELAQIEDWTLLELLRQTRKYNATDSRDKLFALHVVVTDPASIGAAVDYSKSLEEAYTDVTVHELMQKKTLFSLANAGVSTNAQNPRFPSWVADWSHENERKTIIAAGARFNADGGCQPVLSISQDRTILSVRGFVFDNPYGSKVGGGTKEKDSRGETLNRELYRIGKGCSPSLGGQTSEEVLWRTLCCDLTPDIPPGRAPASYGGGYQLLRKFHEATREDGSYDFTHEVYKNPEFLKNNWIPSSVFINSVQKFTIARNMCVTARAYLRRVPRASEIGDKVCILFVGCVPFMLRETGDGHFQFIGECYIHGIMGGEAMKDQAFKVRSRNFDIR